MEGSREEVMRFMRLVVAEFQIPDERTSGRELRGWAVNLCKMCKMAKNDFFRLTPLCGEVNRYVESGSSRLCFIVSLVSVILEN